MNANQTAEALRASAAADRAAAAESFDRSDTDGFVTQWAHGISAHLKDAQADIVANGGMAEVPALFDLDGNLVAAKLVQTRYGMAWGILPSDDPSGRFVGWFNPSEARKGATRLATDRRKGYTEGVVKAPAKAEIVSSGTGLSGAASARVAVRRTDGGFSRDVEIVTTVSEGYNLDF